MCLNIIFMYYLLINKFIAACQKPNIYKEKIEISDVISQWHCSSDKKVSRYPSWENAPCRFYSVQDVRFTIILKYKIHSSKEILVKALYSPTD